jgi:hypothetical protein
VVTPDGSVPGTAPACTRADPALVKALAQAHRWKRLLEEGRYSSLTELAKAEKINRSYLGKMLRLTLLAPDIVEAVLTGGYPQNPGMLRLIESLPAVWTEQRTKCSPAPERCLRNGIGCDTHRPNLSIYQPIA